MCRADTGVWPPLERILDNREILFERIEQGKYLSRIARTIHRLHDEAPVLAPDSDLASGKLELFGNSDRLTAPIPEQPGSGVQWDRRGRWV